MKKSIKIFPIVLVLVFFLASCSLPFGNKPEPAGPEEPNLTLTALFNTNLNIPPTVTPQLLPTVEAASPTAEVILPSATNTVMLPSATVIPPTNTPRPMVRGGQQMQAGYLSDAPVFDGTYEEWLGETSKYKLPYVVWGAGNWKNQADLEGAFAATWDEDYLYISVKVTDDIFVQNKTGEMMYNGDSVEILIDANLLGDFYVQGLDNDDFQFGISPGNDDKGIDPEVYLWFPSGSAGTKTKVKLASLFESDPIYRVEVGIPWSMLGVTPSNGLRLGFAVSINDNDNTSANEQQSMISTAQYRNFLDPTTWGELILVK